MVKLFRLFLFLFCFVGWKKIGQFIFTIKFAVRIWNVKYIINPLFLPLASNNMLRGRRTHSVAIVMSTPG